MSDQHPIPAAAAIEPPAQRRVLCTIAAFEATKGLAALAGLVGVLDLLHHDVRHLAVELIGRFGLNPQGHYPSLLLHYADLLPDANVHALIGIACAYIAVRLLEAYGLWHDRAWAEWLAALSGGLYVPFEFEHLVRHVNFINGFVLAANVAVVSFLVWQLWRRRQGRVIREIPAG